MRRLILFILASSIVTLAMVQLLANSPTGKTPGKIEVLEAQGSGSPRLLASPGIVAATAGGLQFASPEAYTYGYDLMARVISGEARGEPYVGQVAVGAVIMNRVQSPLFPNTIPGVIFEPDAFTAVANGEIWSHVPSATAYRAAQDALAGWDPTGGALYYYNPARATNWWVASRPVTAVIGNHVFTR